MWVFIRDREGRYLWMLLLGLHDTGSGFNSAPVFQGLQSCGSSEGLLPQPRPSTLGAASTSATFPSLTYPERSAIPGGL